jgi:hypothetical protein
VLADGELLARHDLELPAGFDLSLVERRPRLDVAAAPAQSRARRAAHSAQ